MVETEYSLGKGADLVFLSSSALPPMERQRKSKGRRAEGVRKVQHHSSRGERNRAYTKRFTKDGGYVWDQIETDGLSNQNNGTRAGISARAGIPIGRLIDDGTRRTLGRITSAKPRT